ncbi:MAG TPA: hypothetical protein ENJ82_05635 [Bacteroidetes bacterium]|nr:hypothetical protein [Bacteroidota bacterium]
MVSLGDFFSDLEKQKFASRAIGRGSILRLKVEGIDHEKIVVVLGISKKKALVGTVYINTNKRRGSRLPYQVALGFEGREEYLNYTSFVDCGRIHELSLPKVQNQLKIDTEVYQADILEDDLIDIMQTVKGATTIPLVYKKRYGIV